METVVLPSSVTSIGTYAFDGCSAIKTISIPEGVTTISNYSFRNCSALESVTLGSEVKSINQYAFSGCTALQAISIPESVTSIGTYAFDGCSAIKTISIPEGVTTISNYSFRNCSALESVTLGSEVKSINQYAFSGCTALQAISIPESVTSIGTYAFANCSSLKTIILPEGVTTINNYTFQNCSALENITLGSNVNTLGNYAFNGCTALKVLELPATISTIGRDMVIGATSVNVYVCNATPFNWGNSFKVSDEAYAPIYVVYGAKADYEAANNWNLSVVNEVVPTIAVDMENKTVLVDYNNAILTVPVTKSYAETIPARFIEANDNALNNETKVVVKFRKIAKDEATAVDAGVEYTSVDATLNEDGTYTADLLNYIEENAKYEYYWEITMAENEPVKGALDYFTTSYLVTGIGNTLIDNDNNNNAVEYYNLQGVKVNKHEKGVYIKKQGAIIKKVVLK